MPIRNPFRQHFLFQRLVPLSRSAHVGLGINLSTGLAPYEWHLVPIVLSEIQNVAAFYPIVVTKEQELQLCALVGLHPTRSLFLERDGRWAKDHYVPLYLRQTPFFVKQQVPNHPPTLHIDIDDPAVDDRFADKIILSGGINPRLNDRVAAASALAAEQGRTASFLNSLVSANVLRNLSAFRRYSATSVANDLLGIWPPPGGAALATNTADSVRHCAASLGRIVSLRALQEARYHAEEQMDRPDL
ncbi:MAG: SapC family protein [Alphaproteobacteria bacterium]|nr:SapC family protein [Alphaproteobacteria bacterium]